MFKQKKMVNVGVAVNIDGNMEVAVVDVDAKKVTDYRTVPLEYNFQTKEIADYAIFGASLKQVLYDELNLNPKNINLVLTIPSIHFATGEIPEGVSPTEESAIKTILSSYAQDSYLFKRHEPTNAYQLYTNNPKGPNTVIYSSLQASAVDSICDVLVNDVGIEKFSINNPYASIINALDYCGCIEKQVNSNEVWNFVQITNNGFTLFSMYGTKIREINDMPLPLKTFSPEEIYESMALSLQNNLSIYPASSLYVLSRTDLLSAQILLQNMELRGEVDFLENNKFLVEPFIEIDENVDADLALKKMSVEVVGSAITNKNSPLDLHYITNNDPEEEVYGFINVFGQEVPLNNTLINMALGIILGIFIGLGLVLFFGAKGINAHIEKEKSKLQSEKASIQSEIDRASGETGGNVDTIIADITKNNAATLAYFKAISSEIPANMWLTYFYSDSSGALGIKGNTNEVGSLYSFFSSIKNAVPQSSINLSKLEYNDIDALLSPDSQGNKTMNFEITNNSYNNVVSMMASQLPTDEKTDDNKTSGSGNGTNKKTKDDNKQPGKPPSAPPPSGDDSNDDSEDIPLPPIDPPKKLRI